MSLSAGRARAAVVAVVAALAAAGIAIPALVDDGSNGSPAPVQVPPTESPSELSPAERTGIAATLAAIDSGTLPYEQDGATFENREGLLPDRPGGHYREYTVETPGSPDRGARRLVIGADGETYYTADHYASFARIDPEEFR